MRVTQLKSGAGMVLCAALVACSHGGQSTSVLPAAGNTAPRSALSESCTSSITANFNGTPIAAGDTIWFSSVMKVHGLGTSPVTIHVDHASVSFTAAGTPYSVAVPDSAVTFSPSAATATVSYANGWTATVPMNASGNTFSAGAALPLPSGLAAGVQNVTWNAHFASSQTTVTINWQWAAAAYSQFDANLANVGAKASDDNHYLPYQNSDHAGTPENFKSYVVGGATGGGGSNYTGGYSGTASVTPCALPAWTTLSSLPKATAFLGAGAINGILYAVGGQSPGPVVDNALVAYNPATNTWVNKSPMPTPRYFLNVGVANGYLYAVEGCDFAGCFSALERYDPTSDSWTTLAPSPIHRDTAGLGVVNGVLYVVGGFSNFDHAEVEAYDTATDSWSAKASMPTARSGPAVAVANGILYALGGAQSGSVATYLNTVEAYDPSTDTWSTKAPMPTASYLAVAETINGKIYVVGGNTATANLNIVQVYDPSTNAWTTAPSMPTTRYGAASGVINNTLYVVGGFDTTYLDTLEAFTP